METDGKRGKTRDLYKKVREVTGKYTARLDGLRSKGGRHITDSVEIKGRWKEYTEELYKRER